MISIKEKIGQRIYQERKARKLTRKALAELTDDLNAPRINNWERGIRTPGPNEIKQLAQALNVSPGYLMCLSDEKQTTEFPWLGALVPLLNSNQACHSEKYIAAIQAGVNNDSISLIPLSPELSNQLGDNAFALRIQDDSMWPELKINDLLIVDTNKNVSPGSLVLVQLQDSQEVVVRRYRQLTADKPAKEYELIARNENWANIRADQDSHHRIIGVALTLIRVEL